MAKEKCETCKGRGKVDYKNERRKSTSQKQCKDCGGTGEKKEK